MSKKTFCDDALDYLYELNSRIDKEIEDYSVNVMVGDYKTDSCTSFVMDRLNLVQEEIRNSIRSILNYEESISETD